MKQVDVITKYFHPVTAGIETNIRETYSILVKKGWKVNIHTIKDTYLDKNSLPDKETFRDLDIFRYKFYGDLLGYFPKIDMNKTNLVAIHNFNVYYIWLLAYILVLKMFGKKRFAVVVTPHGGFNPEWKVFGKTQAILKSLYHKTLGAFLINNVSDGVRAVSKWEAEEMIKQNIRKDEINVITNGLENEAYEDVDKLATNETKIKVEKYGKYLLQIGRIYPIKNYETTIRALSKIDDDIKFVIVGPIEKNQFPEYYNELMSLIKSLKLENRIIFHGVEKNMIDKYYLIKHSLMMVHMAIWESFCNVIHEALSQGKVCVVANNTALPYLIKDGVNGFLVDTYDSDKLAEKINYVYKNINSPEIKTIERNNKKVGDNESWTSVAVKMNKWYLSLSQKYTH